MAVAKKISWTYLFFICMNMAPILGSPHAQPMHDILSQGFSPIPLVTADQFQRYHLQELQKAGKMALFCQLLDAKFKRYGWRDEPCGATNWQAKLLSGDGHPLIFRTFGDGSNTTLLLGGVHPDELTPIPLAFRFAKYLQDHPHALDGKGIRVVVAPLVNPDGFFAKKPTRTNTNGIDINRNFFTRDWYGRALQLWERRRSKRPRYFPGNFPNSEIETIFQADLIHNYRPNKILSLHAPLGFLDYDGPGDQLQRPKGPVAKQARKLVKKISEKTKNYRVVDYSFYPGSLGNFAGNERGIPTVTLELKTTNPKKVNEYWEQFLPGMIQTIHYVVDRKNGDKTFSGLGFFSWTKSKSSMRR